MRSKMTRHDAASVKVVADKDGYIQETYFSEPQHLYRNGKVLGSYWTRPPKPRDLTPEQTKLWNDYWEQQEQWWISEVYNNVRRCEWAEPGRKFD